MNCCMVVFIDFVWLSLMSDSDCMIFLFSNCCVDWVMCVWVNVLVGEGGWFFSFLLWIFFSVVWMCFCIFIVLLGDCLSSLCIWEIVRVRLLVECGLFVNCFIIFVIVDFYVIIYIFWFEVICVFVVLLLGKFFDMCFELWNFVGVGVVKFFFVNWILIGCGRSCVILLLFVRLIIDWVNVCLVFGFCIFVCKVL